MQLRNVTCRAAVKRGPASGSEATQATHDLVILPVDKAKFSRRVPSTT